MADKIERALRYASIGANLNHVRFKLVANRSSIRKKMTQVFLTFTTNYMHPKLRSKILSTAVLVLASSSLSQAANVLTTNTVGTINGNNKTISEATGNSFDATTFASTIATAFSNNTGGVWNFDTAFSGNVNDTVTLNYGVSQSKSLVLTLTAGDNINQGNVAGEATSGSFELGLGGSGITRTFTPSTPLLAIGIFNLDRNDSSRTSSISVTYLDNTTASTSGANADNTYFHGLSGTLANPIKSFSIIQSNFVRYDDLGFVAVPEPASAATLVGLAAVGFVALRRRRSKA